MFSKFDQWNTQQSRMETYQKAQQKSLRISEATTGKTKKRKPENKGKHRKTDKPKVSDAKKIVVNKSGLSRTSVRTENKGNVDVDINIIKRGNRKGAGRPPTSTSVKKERTLKDAFEFRDKTSTSDEERRRIRIEDRAERDRRFNLEQQREQQRQVEAIAERRLRREELDLRRQDLVAQRAERQLERRRIEALMGQRPAPANHPDDIGRGIAEMNARIDRLDANVRAGQNIAPPPINVEVNPRINVNPNIRVVGVEAGGIVINNEGARAVANQRGRRANIDRRGGGNLGSDSSSSEGFSSPTEEQRAIARRQPASRRRQPPPQRRQQPSAPEQERALSSSDESSVIVERQSGSERDEPSLAQRGAEALIDLGRAGGGAVARGVGAGLSTIGERAVEALPSAEDIGGVIGGAVATGAGIVGRGALALGQRAYENLPPAQNLLADAIQQQEEQSDIELDPLALQSVSEGESSSGEERVVAEPTALPSTIAQRIAQRREEQQREFDDMRRREQEERQRELSQRQRDIQRRAEVGEQSGILADIQQTIQSGIQTGVNVLRDAINPAPQRQSTPAPLGLGEEPEVRRGSIGSGVDLLSDYFAGSGSEGESSGTDTSYSSIAKGRKPFSQTQQQLLDIDPNPQKPPKESTLLKSDLDDPFVALEQFVKTGGDIAKEGDTPPSSPEQRGGETDETETEVATKKPQPEPEGESETDTDTEEKFRDLRKLSPEKVLKTAERLQRQQIKVDSLLSEALSPKDFFGQSGDLEVSGFGEPEESSSEGENIADRRRRERATIRREQLRRGVSKEQADRLAKIGTRYLGDSSSSDESGNEQNEREQRIMNNQQFIAKLEKSLELLSLQRARKSGMGQEAKTQYDRNISEHQRVLGLLRGQNSIILEGKPYGSPLLNNDSPLIQTADRIISGGQLVETKGGSRVGAGRPVVKVSDNPEIQTKFERVLQSKTGNVRLLNDRLAQFRVNRVDSAITTRDRGTLERFLTGRASTEQLEEILRIYDDILENKRLERLYRKGNDN